MRCSLANNTIHFVCHIVKEILQRELKNSSGSQAEVITNNLNSLGQASNIATLKQAIRYPFIRQLLRERYVATNEMLLMILTHEHINARSTYNLVMRSEWFVELLA